MAKIHCWLAPVLIQVKNIFNSIYYYPDGQPKTIVNNIQSMLIIVICKSVFFFVEQLARADDEDLEMIIFTSKFLRQNKITQKSQMKMSFHNPREIQKILKINEIWLSICCHPASIAFQLQMKVKKINKLYTLLK